jgi:hypothetical protein
MSRFSSGLPFQAVPSVVVLDLDVIRSLMCRGAHQRTNQGRPFHKSSEIRQPLRILASCGRCKGLFRIGRPWFARHRQTSTIAAPLTIAMQNVPLAARDFPYHLLGKDPGCSGGSWPAPRPVDSIPRTTSSPRMQQLPSSSYGPAACAPRHRSRSLRSTLGCHGSFATLDRR